MSAFSHHIFVCGNQRADGHPRGCCDPSGHGELRECLKKALKARGLSGEVRANQAGCLDQCEWGPTLVIYPQGIWYGGVKPEDVPRIVEETIVGGKVIQRDGTPTGELPGRLLRANRLGELAEAAE